MTVRSTQSLYGRSYGNRYFVVAVSFILILFALAWLAERLDRELLNAEKTQFNLRLSELQLAVMLMQGSLVAKDDVRGYKRYVGSNPMALFEEETTRYLGEMSLDSPERKPGNWVYDPQLKEIAYLPQNASRRELKDSIKGGLISSTDGDKKYTHWLRFKVVGLLSNEEKYSDRQSFIGLELRLVN